MRGDVVVLMRESEPESAELASFAGEGGHFLSEKALTPF